MDRCYFAREVPDIEERDGLVFIQPVGARCQIAMNPATLAKFVARANQVLDGVYEHRRTGVVPIRARH